MRALRVGEGATTVADVPVPGRDEALVRVVMSGICNTDLELAKGYMGFRGTIGHELVGIVEEAEGFARGTRVVCEINAGCGTCALCAAGDPRHCPTRTVMGIVGRDGAHADYLRMPARNLIAVPDGIRDEHAVFVEPLAAAHGVLERVPVEASARIAIIGDGKLGLLCALALRDRAPLLVGKHPEKRALARGVEGVSPEDAARRARTFDVVIEASGNASGFALALDLLRPQGTLVLKSTFAGSTPIDAARIVVDEIAVIGSRCGRFAPALSLVPKFARELDTLISEVIPLDRGVEAMATAAKPGVLKVLLSR
jgi:threonine dehydrogenase-like Zn-dependent dehydrogenase